MGSIIDGHRLHEEARATQEEVAKRATRRYKEVRNIILVCSWLLLVGAEHEAGVLIFLPLKEQLGQMEFAASAIGVYAVALVGWWFSVKLARNVAGSVYEATMENWRETQEDLKRGISGGG